MGTVNGKAMTTPKAQMENRLRRRNAFASARGKRRKATICAY